MDKSGNKPDKVSYRIDQATITCREPGGQPYQANKWRVIAVEERYFYYDTEDAAKAFVRMLEKC